LLPVTSTFIFFCYFAAIYYITVTATDFAGNSSEQPVIVYVSVITLSSNSIPENTVIGSGVKIGDFVVIISETYFGQL
jgi:UDP-3-O-[3-hydroxymyristoyl] glucosamine N-acyltransferase